MRWFAVSLAVFVFACVAEVDEGPVDDVDASITAGGKADGSITAADVAGALRVANELSLDELDYDVALDVRAAEHIVAYRDTPAAPIDTLEELDGIKWVGDRAFGKLVAYAREHGFVDDAPPPGDPGTCLIISEYVEGHGNYNKAVELFNCGGGALSLSDFRICLVRNDDTQCTVTADLGTATLAAGGVTTVCRRQDYHPAGLDPWPQLAQRCDLERASAMTFSGDDRLLVLHDGAVLDSLGRVGYRPPESTWSNKSLRRCNPAAHDGVSYYDTAEYFTQHSAGDLIGFGSAPVFGCP